MIDVTTQDGVADAYLARPDDQRRPAVLLVMDAYGLRPQIERMADRIAAQGYVVLAPNVFYRVGRAPVVPLDGLGAPDQQGALLDRIRPLMRELTPERIVGDGAAYLSTVSSRSAAARSRSPATAWAGGWPGASPRPTLSASRPWAASTSAALSPTMTTALTAARVASPQRSTSALPTMTGA